MVYTPDKHKVKFDQNNEKSKSETYEIAKTLAQFKPTIICVEIVPERNEELNNDYSNFLKNKDYKTKIGGEVALIAYEIGKMSGVKRFMVSMNRLQRHITIILEMNWKTR